MWLWLYKGSDIPADPAWMMGQGIAMGGHNPMVNCVREPATRTEINEMEKSIRYAVDHMPSHGDYLKSYCPAAA